MKTRRDKDRNAKQTTPARREGAKADRAVTSHPHPGGMNRITERSGRVTLSDVSLSIPDGVLVQGIAGSRSSGHAPIKLKIHVTKDDLARLVFLFSEDIEVFNKTFADAIIQPAIAHLAKRTSARGKNKGNETALGWLKLEACELYHLFDFMVANKRMPPFFRMLIEDINAQTNSDSFYRKAPTADRDTNTGVSSLIPMVATAYCLEKYHCLSGKCLPVLGVKSYLEGIEGDHGNDTTNTFYRNYIRGAEPTYQYELPIRAGSSKTRLMNVKELEHLALEESPFSEIFGWLLADGIAPCPREGQQCPSRYLRRGRRVRGA